MSEIILGLDANEDFDTVPLGDYKNKHIYTRISNNGYVVKTLQGVSCKRYLVVQENKQDVCYITTTGHGLCDRFYGYYEVIFEIGQYSPSEVSGKIIYMLSCSTAEALGIDFVTNGCRAFLGYNKPFMYKHLLRDIFFMCATNIDLELVVKKNDVRTAYESTIKLYSDYATMLFNLGYTYESSCLEHNRDCLIGPSISSLYGDSTAKLP